MTKIEEYIEKMERAESLMKEAYKELSPLPGSEIYIQANEQERIELNKAIDKLYEAENWLRMEKNKFPRTLFEPPKKKKGKGGKKS